MTGIEENTGLAYSSLSIFISFFLSLAVASAPLIIGFFAKLPGTMIISQNNSAIISAACHCVVDTNKKSASLSYSSEHEVGESMKKALSVSSAIPLVTINGTDTEYEPENRSREEKLWDLALGRLKWGVVSPGASPGRVYPESEPGHLAFGGAGQDVCAVTDGGFYAGKVSD